MVSEQGMAIAAPVHGTVSAISIGEGDLVAPGDEIVVLEAMKMAHHVSATSGGVVPGGIVLKIVCTIAAVCASAVCTLAVG